MRRTHSRPKWLTAAWGTLAIAWVLAIFTSGSWSRWIPVHAALAVLAAVGLGFLAVQLAIAVQAGRSASTRGLRAGAWAIAAITAAGLAGMVAVVGWMAFFRQTSP